MKFILKFKELFESTSAFSHERAGWEYPPFKFAKNFDPRIGYSKDDFCRDLSLIYKEMDYKKREELMDIIYKESSISKISNIKNIGNSSVNKLMKSIENFLDSKAQKKLIILPDGYILCYERVKIDQNPCDVYYSPSGKSIKISYTDSYPEDQDLLIDLEEFTPKNFGIEEEDFKNIIKKCDDAIAKKQDSFVI